MQEQTELPKSELPHLTSASSEDLPPALFDVRAVNIKTRAERLMREGMTAEEADVFVRIAVFRCGVEEEFYATVPTGTTHLRRGKRDCER